ncbi:hypothetical protein D9M68_101210 [compost metagenome]
MQELAPHDSANLDAFLKSIKPWEAAYGAATLSFIALKESQGLAIVHAHLLLPNGWLPREDTRVETNSLVAGCFRLDAASLTVDGVLRGLCESGLDTSFGRLYVPTEHEGKVSTYFNPWKTGTQDGEARTLAFALNGKRHPLDHMEVVHMAELRASVTPYASLDELAVAINGLPLRRDVSVVDVTAANCVQLDGRRRVKGTIANPAVLLASNLEREKVGLGLSIHSRGKAAQRYRYDGDALHWSEGENGIWTGELEVTVEEGSAVQCFASYGGSPQHVGWIGDPEKLPNVRRAVHEAFDPSLAVLQRYLLDEEHQQKHSRDFEAGVASLFFMLGLSVNAFTGKPMENGPDLIAATPMGQLIIVECTVAQINKEGKLGKLVDRANSLRQKLVDTGHAQLRVLPAIVTPRPREAIAEIDVANGMGIVVLTREDLEAGMHLARAPQDADAWVASQWEKLSQRPDDSGLQMSLFGESASLAKTYLA